MHKINSAIFEEYIYSILVPMATTNITLAAADAAYSKGNYIAAIPFFETCIQEQRHSLGVSSIIDSRTYSSMEKLACCYCKTERSNKKAILVSNERYAKMALCLGEFYPLTLSALHQLAREYSEEDVNKAIALYEECLSKRASTLGASHEATIETSLALSNLKSTRSASNKQSPCRLESLFGKMEDMDMIELIDRRKLNRIGLRGKSELVHLLASNAPSMEKRGVTLKLFQAYRKLALSRNGNPSHWTIARVSALINGNHEILKPNCRFGDVDPTSTLTYDARCSLIDMLLTSHFNPANKHPVLDLSYKECVGEKANLFISFAYADNFIDLVDALELYIETHALECSEESTYFWFDLFVNDQWTASDKGFDWWANIFHQTVEGIGHTLCFLSPWSNPSILTRVWCLLEMRYSPRISIILSRKEVSSFQDTLRSNLFTISKCLCEINAQNATSYVPDDRDRIFKVIEEMDGGFQDFNVKVMDLIREWITVSARSLVGTSDKSGNKDGSSVEVGIGGGGGGEGTGGVDQELYVQQFRDLNHAATLLFQQGKLEEAKELYERAFSGFELTLGPDNENTLSVMNNLASLLQNQGRLDEAKRLHETALSKREQTLGLEHESTLTTVSNLASVLRDLGQFEDSMRLYQRALSGREKLLGPEHELTVGTVGNLAIALSGQGRLEEAKTLYERALSGFERTLGLNHQKTLMTASGLAGILYRQRRLAEAKALYEKALFGQERTIGRFHEETLSTIGGLAIILTIQGQLEEAKKLCVWALSGFEQALGLNHVKTLSAVHDLADVLSKQERFEEAKKLFERALTGFEQNLGFDHQNTLNTVCSLANISYKQGQSEEAKKLYKRALAGYDRTLEPDSDNTLNTANNLANILMGQGRLEEAKRLFDRALSGFERTLGSDHQKTISVVYGLAGLLAKQLQLQESKKLFERVLNSYEKTLGLNHADTLNTVHNLATMSASVGQMEEAKRLSERAVSGFTLLFGRSHPQTNAASHLLLLIKQQL